VATIEVGNTLAGSPTPTIPVFCSSNNRIYVGCATTGANGFIKGIDADPSSPTYNTVVSSLAIGISPNNLIFDYINELIYISYASQTYITVFNPDTNTSVATISVGALSSQDANTNFEIDTRNRNLYFVNYNANNVKIIDIDSSSATYHTVIQTISVGGSGCLYPVFNQASGKVYVSDYDTPSRLVAIDTTDYSTSAVTFSAGNNNYYFRVTSYEGYLYISDFTNNALKIIDTSTDTVVSTITLTGPLQSQVDFIKKVLIIPCLNTGNSTQTIRFLDLDTNELLDTTISLSSGSGGFFTSTPVVDHANERVWVVGQEYRANILSTSGYFIKSTITFQEGSNRWISNYSFWPERYGYANNEMFSFLNGVLWKHNSSSTYNNFHGTQYTSQLRPVFNKEPNIQKNFTSMSLEGDKVWAASSITTPEGQESFILSGHFEKIQHDWYADIKNDINTPNAASTDEALINGDFMQSNVLEVLLELTASDIGKLNSVNVNSNTFR
jgi:YVTN family beta-propeller protein